MPILSEIARNEAVTVGTTSVQIAAPNPRRKVIYYRNSSTANQKITIVQGNHPAILNAGLTLSVGQFVADSDSEGYSCWKGSVQAIADAAGAILSVYEA